MKEKIIDILDKHCEHTEEAAKKIISELKQECETYKDLDKAVKKMTSDIRWIHLNTGEYEPLLSEIRRLIEEEKNNLKINKNYPTITVRLDEAQAKKIEDIVKTFEEFKRTKRVVL